MKIRSVSSTRLIKIFRKRFNVKQNIQFLIYGQIIPEGGFKTEKAQAKETSNSLKTLRTQDLKDLHNEDLLLKDEEERYRFSKSQLNQYNQVKNILINMTFKDKGKGIISPEIVLNVVDEMRSERKTGMVLTDMNIDKYIS